jgi:hypothetical protein
MNNSMTLSVLPNISGRRTAVGAKHPAKDTRGLFAATARAAEETAANTHDWRWRGLQQDWRVLAREWLALTRAVEEFEREFGWLEKNFDRRWKRRAGVDGNRGPQIGAANSNSEKR